MRKIIPILLILFLFPQLIIGQPKEVTYVIPVKGVIDLGLAAFIKRSIGEARQNNAKIIIFEIDTFGGRVDAALDICGYIEEAKPLKTVAFIKERAWSAGALISLSCQTIVMSPTASIGSAEPRAMGFGQQDDITDEKIVSAIRAQFKSLAEANNHPVNLALAMVDKDFEVKQVRIKDELKILTSQEFEEIKPNYSESEIRIIKTINPKGKLLNLTATEAKEFGLAKEIVNDRNALLMHLGLKENNVVVGEVNWSEGLVRFLTHPIISPLLLTLGFLGLFFEFKTPGWGITGTLGVIFLILFFWGHYLAGLAHWTEILIFSLGVILLLLEIFVIPGFGITGASGITLILIGIFLALLKYPLTLPKMQLTKAFYTLGYGIILTGVGVIAILKFLPKSSFWKQIVLTAKEKKEEGFSSAIPLDSYLGKNGRAITALRPSGKADFAGEILDVVSEGDFIDKDKTVTVIAVQGGKLVVKERTRV